MKKLLRLLAVCCIFAMMFCITPLTAHAATNMNPQSANGSSKFTSEWEKTTTYKIDGQKIGIMIWGYDEDYVNEDYVWSIGYECNSKPALFRDGHDTAYVNGTSGQPHLYGKIEVKHQTYYVKYRVTFAATYNMDDIIATTVSSSVK